MVRKITMSDVLVLSPAERIQLVEDIWDSIAEVPEAVPLTEAQRMDLDARLAAYHADPGAGSKWEEVKARILRAR
jgi:putative addiction module component (TIGR02574 family)